MNPELRRPSAPPAVNLWVPVVPIMQPPPPPLFEPDDEDTSLETLPCEPLFRTPKKLLSCCTLKQILSIVLLTFMFEHGLEVKTWQPVLYMIGAQAFMHLLRIFLNSETLKLFLSLGNIIIYTIFICIDISLCGLWVPEETSVWITVILILVVKVLYNLHKLS